MWENKRFVATRDPRKGGLHIAAVTKGFDKAVQMEIENNCLELIARDMDTPCVSVYGLKSGGYVVSMAMKVTGGQKESRTHEIIRGIILENGQLSEFCRTYMSGDVLKEIFFHGKTDPDAPEEWVIPAELLPSAKKEMQNPINQMEGRMVIGLYNALKEIDKKHIKIHLVVPDEMKMQTMMLLCCMEEVAGLKLFFVENGECTMQGPDILIHDQPVYQDMRKYRKMTLEQFFRMGDGLVAAKADDGIDEEREEVDEDQQKIEDLLELCMDYITDKYISDYEVCEAWGNMQRLEPGLYRRFLVRLRREMFLFQDAEYYAGRYMRLLYALFRINVQNRDMVDLELQTSPYDFNGMYWFLKKKSKSRREWKRLTLLMLECQFRECIAGFDERNIQEAAKNTVELL